MKETFFHCKIKLEISKVPIFPRARVDLERDYIFGKVQTNLQAHIPAKLFEFDVFDWLKLCFEINCYYKFKNFGSNMGKILCSDPKKYKISRKIDSSKSAIISKYLCSKVKVSS